MHVLPVEQLALEWFDHCIDFPLGPVLVLQEVLDAVPLCRTVELAVHSIVKKLTMLLTDILFIFLAVFDLHHLPPRNSLDSY
jgi:hypothetical protein